ncbi:hypothetical protein L596_030495 [Steinernema carpocapsae]|uniref:Uncharacterized protein n=1 Tax=Steinernema carpocapsae TaxID=34508 RepID=A0A4U5LPL2_STECR|nr:hypothetical protein L596_030495 [Steinernema carpocapsae]
MVPCGLVFEARTFGTRNRCSFDAAFGAHLEARMWGIRCENSIKIDVDDFVLFLVIFLAVAFVHFPLISCLSEDRFEFQTFQKRIQLKPFSGFFPALLV